MRYYSMRVGIAEQALSKLEVRQAKGRQAKGRQGKGRQAKQSCFFC